MNITSAQYSRDAEDTKNVCVVATINGIKMHVPLDPANTEYAAILEWAEEDGNTIQEAD